MKNSIGRNYLYNASYQIITLISPFITTPYLSRVLGPDGIGIFSYTTAIVSYFIMAAQFGLGRYAQREIAYHQDSSEDYSRIFIETLMFSALLVVLAFGVFIIFALHADTYQTIFFVQSINILAVFFDISWFFQGLEEFGKVVFRNLIIKLISVIGIFIVVQSSSDLVIYIIFLGLTNLLASLSLWFYVPGYIQRVSFATLHPFHNIKAIVELFLPQVATSIYLTLDKVMIGAIGNNPLQNGWYEQAEKIAKMPIALTTALGPVMMPRIAYEYSKRNFSAIIDYMKKSARFVWMITIPVTFGLMGVVDNFIPWFLGDGYYESILLTKILCGVIIAISFSDLLGTQYLIPTNKQRIYNLTIFTGVLVNIVLNLLLIKQFLAVGAAMATVTTEFVVTIAMGMVLRHELPLLKMLCSSVRYIFAGSCMLAVLTFLNIFLVPSFINTVVLIFSGAIVYILMMVALHDSMFFSLLHKVSEKINSLEK